MDSQASALFPKLPCPPFHHVPGVSNFRDIGGYPVSPPGRGSVRRRFIYRSALPTRITPAGCEVLVSDLKIRVIYDFRSHLEIEKEPPKPVPGAVRYHIPVFPTTDLSPEKLAQRLEAYMSERGPSGFVYAYSEILRSGNPAYRTVLEHVRDRPQEPFLVHCTSGKDRTGVFVALLLRLAGVKDLNMVANEYQLTEMGLGSLVETVTEGLLKDGKIGSDREGVKRLLSAKAENLKASMEWLDQTYGGVEEYLKTVLKFNDEDIRKIKANLIAEDEEAIFNK
ncbi:hypothetical protein ASPZODRAFT_61689 [Penicilliopsis zonata CBS 506.65]|uniref:Tyrosine specific protein phosphatases domain-containing protein n=1 Tax=Penicilliopsis zonata CBS 506.65 TaxID=1073090 RepID=A0A1L9SMJ0_9EURO|nr:hypothetical protein ASPZODRAFT_61689 [Penicilliopsis zonata CBS 506.65]OJJ48326.1 hypothetical protein ASPZODRAFT_61689 [Penicilliopsis zonata CBS 506.65]